ncbi:MAG: D-alanine--D-alanine ligase [Bdellovibrionales bacterium]
MSKTTSDNRKKIAVFFGGRSPEHDVSVVSGLQVLSAIDESRYDAFPVYIAPDGQWYIGDILRERSVYLLSNESLQKTKSVILDPIATRGGRLISKKRGFIGQTKPIEFDIAMPCFHGLYGEDGNIQGVFELTNTPYTGMRTLASAVLMDKVATKKILQSADIPTLPYAVLKRPETGLMIPTKEIKEQVKHLKFPCIIKPVHLGSSIGVAKVDSPEDIKATLPAIFEFDDSAILEPFVENLVEYNVAVSKAFGDIQLSAIERPKASEELLDFKQKYLSGKDSKTGDKTAGTKQVGAISEGMLSLTRELNPKLDKKQTEAIQKYATAMFETINGTGAPRIDFIGNQKTGELWLNEVNPIPGSFGYFLWEAAEDSKLFTEFLTALLEEALQENIGRSLPKDPVPKDARLFKR